MSCANYYNDNIVICEPTLMYADFSIHKLFYTNLRSRKRKLSAGFGRSIHQYRSTDTCIFSIFVVCPNITEIQAYMQSLHVHVGEIPTVELFLVFLRRSTSDVSQQNSDHAVTYI